MKEDQIPIYRHEILDSYVTQRGSRIDLLVCEQNRILTPPSDTEDFGVLDRAIGKIALSSYRHRRNFLNPRIRKNNKLADQQRPISPVIACGKAVLQLTSSIADEESECLHLIGLKNTMKLT